MDESQSSNLIKNVIAVKIKNHLNTEQLSHLERWVSIK